MSDLPQLLQQQQQKATPISGLELETFGKHAAKLYTQGQYATVQEALIETIKTSALSPEQVRRVVEFANTAAYLNELEKCGSHRYVELQGGPADPGDVLRDLNDGGAPEPARPLSSDYDLPPEDLTKKADAARHRLGIPDHLDEAFKTGGRPEAPYADPLQDSIRLRHKLAGAHGDLMSQLSSLETNLMVEHELLYRQVKEAALKGTDLGDVLQAWAATGHEPEMAKVAFRFITPTLLRENVYKGRGDVAASLSRFTKTAAMVNIEHPLVKTYDTFCTTLKKLAHVRATEEEVRSHLDGITTFIIQAGQIKEAGKGALVGKVLGKGIHGARRARGAAKAGFREAGQQLTEALGGGRGARLAGGALALTPAAAELAALGLGGEAIHEHLKYSPSMPARAARATGEYLTGALMPTSEAGLRRRYRIQSGQ